MEQTAIPPSRTSSFAEIQDIRDIKDPVAPFPNHFPMIIPLIFAIFVALIIHKMRRAKRQNLPALLPHEAAREALEALKRKDLVKKGRMMDYYLELSDIMRRYLGSRLNYRTWGMTTEELTYSIGKSEKLPPEQRQLVGDFLIHCDLVKYAGYWPPLEEAESALQMGTRIVSQIGPARDPHEGV